MGRASPGWLYSGATCVPEQKYTTPSEMQSERTELVVFDCDGVLVDSEVISNTVLAEFISDLGWAVDLEDALARFKGLAMTDIWAIVANAIGRPVTAEIDRAFRERQLIALKAGVKAVPGVSDLVATLEISYCVASNGPPEKMATTLEAAGLLRWFEGRMFSRIEVARPKPYPDLFLHAAARMRRRPDQTVVIEDSPLGIEAALRAGMRAIGFAGTLTADASALSRAGPERVLMDIRELANWL